MDIAVAGRKAFAATGGRPFDSKRPTVVFVHGAGMDHTVWALQSRWFAHHGRSVLAVDLPDHGRSDGPALDSIGAQADWLLALLDAVELDAAGAETAALVGHSMGALAALAVAAKAPGRVSKLALLGAAVEIKVHPDLLDAARRNEPHAYALVTSWGFGRAANLGVHKMPGLWMMGGGRQLLGHARAGVLATDLGACDAYADGRAAVARVGCPVLMLCGGADLMTPATGTAALAGLLKDARTETIPGAGHMMMIERPDETLDALKAFL